MSTNFNPYLANDAELERAIVALRAARPGEFAVLVSRLEGWRRKAYRAACGAEGQQSDRSLGSSLAFDDLLGMIADADGVIKEEKQPEEEKEAPPWDE
ncbi:MAG: hypothetical protein IJT88_09600 [Kiritimatiellae bacterium]|nr:hypothetical protein [Kiritimatiellia bacterium]